jgi:hypothetical protein
LVYGEYKNFCFHNGIESIGRTNFYTTLRKHKLIPVKIDGISYLHGADIVNATAVDKIKKDMNYIKPF